MDCLIKNKKTVSAISITAFAISYIVCALLYWFDVIKESFLTTSLTLGQEIELSAIYITVSSVFVVILILNTVFGGILKSKSMLYVSLIYTVTLVVSFIGLGIFSTGQIESYGLNNVFMWVLSVCLAPVYGFVWIAGIFFVILLIVLLFLSIVLLVKIYRSKK